MNNTNQKNIIKDHYQIQGVEHKSYEGFSLGNKFFDYECPWFSLEVSLELMKDLNEYWANTPTEECIIYDKKEDCFLYTHKLLEEGQVIKFKAQKHNNKKVYGIGSSSWCWYTENSMQKELKLQGKEINFERVNNKQSHLKLVVNKPF